MHFVLHHSSGLLYTLKTLKPISPLPPIQFGRALHVLLRRRANCTVHKSVTESVKPFSRHSATRFDNSFWPHLHFAYRQAHCSPSASRIPLKLRGLVADTVPSTPQLSVYRCGSLFSRNQCFCTHARLGPLVHLHSNGPISREPLSAARTDLARSSRTSSPSRPFDPFPHIYLGWPAVHAFVRHLRLGLCLVLLFFAYKT